MNASGSMFCDRCKRMKPIPGIPRPPGVCACKRKDSEPDADAGVPVGDQIKPPENRGQDQDARDAARWRFYAEHAQSMWQGRKLGEFLVFDGVMKYGSRNACIDAAMAQPTPPDQAQTSGRG